MEKNRENHDLDIADAKLSKCNQCNYASNHAGNLRTHLKMHIGEKSNKCNQCDYASSYANHLKIHLKIHSGEKSYKCNHCDCASSYASHLRTHLKIHNGKSHTNATNVTMHPINQAILGFI